MPGATQRARTWSFSHRMWRPFFPTPSPSTRRCECWCRLPGKGQPLREQIRARKVGAPHPPKQRRTPRGQYLVNPTHFPYNKITKNKQRFRGVLEVPIPQAVALSMDELQHECGIAAIYHFDTPSTSTLVPSAGSEEVSRLMPRMLLDLQNRGQLAAGLTTYNPNRGKILDTYKQIGTVIEAFRLNHHAKYESIMRDTGGAASPRPSPHPPPRHHHTD